MRRWMLIVLLCAGCSRLTLTPPTKIHEVPGEVFWLYSNLQIIRCWQHKAGAPVCMPAVMLQNPIEMVANRSPPADSPAHPPQPDPTPDTHNQPN